MKLNPICLIIPVALILASCSSHKNSVKTKRAKYETTVKNNREKINESLQDIRGEEKKIVEEALKWLGTKYEYGGQTKGKSTDCSGMVMVIYQEIIGCKLPRNSAKQAEVCNSIKLSDARPGDLIFFITNGGNKINHVGIMIDSTQFVHASTRGVVVASLETEYYRTHMKKMGRVPCMKH